MPAGLSGGVTITSRFIDERDRRSPLDEVLVLGCLHLGVVGGSEDVRLRALTPNCVTSAWDPAKLWVMARPGVASLQICLDLTKRISQGCRRKEQ